jgi:hypothetical protein
MTAPEGAIMSAEMAQQAFEAKQNGREAWSGRMAHASDRRHVCVACRERRSLFRYRGQVRADADHTLCFRCFRSLKDHVRAVMRAAVAA